MAPQCPQEKAVFPTMSQGGSGSGPCSSFSLYPHLKFYLLLDFMVPRVSALEALSTQDVLYTLTT